MLIFNCQKMTPRTTNQLLTVKINIVINLTTLEWIKKKFLFQFWFIPHPRKSRRTQGPSARHPVLVVRHDRFAHGGVQYDDHQYAVDRRSNRTLQRYSKKGEK